MKKILLALAVLLVTQQSPALRLERIKYGDFSNWVTRNITESKAIGGKKKTIYAIGPAQTINGAQAYTNRGGSPWASSNVYAKVAGITKASGTVTPFNRGGGNKCARLTSAIEEVKALGIITLDVMVGGTIFLGKMHEPITGTGAPFAKMEMGMPFNKRPAALVFDYKVEMPNTNTRIKATGKGGKKVLKGRDQAEVYVLLQKRWEDAKGNIHAQRVGTGRERFSRSTGWINGHQLKIQYGDITKKPGYKPYMGLLNGSKAYYAKNSKGRLVPVNEEGWAPANATPTHVLVMASSTCGEPFVGTPGVTLYVDNFAFGY